MAKLILLLKEEAQLSFTEWMKLKREQKQSKESAVKARQKFLAETLPGHTKEECEIAFKKQVSLAFKMLMNVMK